jgi:hypothetical protein
MKSKQDYLDRVRSDQMVLRIVRWELDRMSGGQRHSKTKLSSCGDQKARVHSEKMDLVMAKLPKMLRGRVGSKRVEVL